MKKYFTYIYAVLGLALLIGFDQFTKYIARINLSDGNTISIIKNVLQFNYVQNTGAAWGIMSGKQLFFVILTTLLVIVLIYIYIKTPNTKKYTPLKITIVVLTAGALGNYIDRATKGYVDDFIDFYLINFPVFNVADICVSLSMVSLLILIIFIYKDHDFDFLKKNNTKIVEDKQESDSTDESNK